MKALILLLAFAGGASWFKEAVLIISGATCFEELDYQVIEQFERYLDHPLDINAASKSRLISCGLFSSFQVASLMDSRKRTGAVLSEEELSLVDGFDVSYAHAVSQFVVFRSGAPPGQRMQPRVCHDLTLRGSWRGGELNGGGKYTLEAGDVFGFNIASTGTFSLCWNSRRLPLKLIIGDFNARFGQGVAMWSGFTMSGLPTVLSFRKNPGGIMAAGGYSSVNHRGVAAGISTGPWTFDGAISAVGLRRLMEKEDAELSFLPMLSVTRTGKKASFGFYGDASISSGIRSCTASAEFRAGGSGFSCFGESAVRYYGASTFSAAGVAGVIYTPSYGTGFSLLARYYSPGFDGEYSGAVRSASKVSDELGASAGVSKKWGGATVDYAWHPSKGTRQTKILATVSHVHRIGESLTLTPAFRVSGRYMSRDSAPFRTDLRADLAAALGEFQLSARYNMVFCRDMSWMWYAEAGWKMLFMRFTLFKVDSWDDRIYVYERDAPGSFNVPACYGRGYGVSLYAATRIGRCHRFYARASWISYPWMDEPKPSVPEIKMQYCLSLH